ncbi:MAG: M20 family metallopeptidase [Gemmatimonadaceae bacterium]
MRALHRNILLSTALLMGASRVVAQRPDPLLAEIERRAKAVAPQMTEWRHDIHRNPELSFQETRTAALVAAHLTKLGIEVRTGVGGNGVVGTLTGGRPGPVVALRADMDALPVTELADVPYKSTVRTVYNGAETGVMHACGHDMHVAILMGTAEVLAGMRAQLSGTVKFVFQPAEEAPPVGGAGPMIRDGVLSNPSVDAIFALHVFPGPLGRVEYRAGPVQASTDNLRIVVRGRQAHGAMPSAGVDPLVVGAQILLGLQTIVSRQVDLAAAPLVVTVGAFNGGLRENIIPDTAVMIGTIRALSPSVRTDVHARVRRTAEKIAEAAGAKAEVTITEGYPVTVNDRGLAEFIGPVLRRTVGDANVDIAEPSMPAEDFSRFQEKVPGLMFGLSVSPPGVDPSRLGGNHSPLFQGDDAALEIGVRVMANTAVAFLRRPR